MAQLQRALFRSLLRWNRRKYVLESRFRINPVDFRCQDFFPPSTIIQDASGFQGAIYHAFRNSEASPQATNEALRVLRQLNDFALQIKETAEKRNLNSNDQTLSFAKFKIGQVVQNRETKVRGVVIGWKVNFTRKTQTVQIISDFDDTNKQTTYDISIRPEFVSASELELVEDPSMMRIFHFDTDKYFIAFDEKHARYIPNAELLYLYPRDFDSVYNPEKHGDQYPCSVSENDRRFLERMDTLVKSQGDKIQSLSQKFFPWRKGTNVKEPPRSTVHHITDEDTEINRKVISEQILEDVFWRIGRLQQTEGSMPASTRLKSGNGTDPFSASLGMTYVEGFNQSLNYADTHVSMLFPSKAILLRGAKKADYEATHRNFQRKLNALHAPWRPIRDIYHRFGHFNELLTHLDQLLQLRYQSRGIAFHTSLSVAFNTPDQLPTTDANTTFPVKRPFPTTGVELRRHEFDASVEQYIQATQKVFPTKFQIGQVVRHKKYGYRGIVTGYDQRPLGHAAKRADMLANSVTEIPRGQEQPFYRLLVDERDEKLFREGKSHDHGFLVFDHTYIPEDCLEAMITTGAHDEHHLIVSNPEITRYFLGWNAVTQRFRARHQLKYAHPEGEHRFPEEYPAKRILTALDERIIADEDQEDSAPITQISPTSLRNRALFAQVGGVANLRSEEEAHALAAAISAPLSAASTDSPLAAAAAAAAAADPIVSSSPIPPGIVADPRLYKQLTRSIVREEVKIYENIDLFLLALNQHVQLFLGGVLNRYLDRIQLVQQNQIARNSNHADKHICSTEVSTTSNITLETPIGKPTVISRGRKHQKKPPALLSLADMPGIPQRQDTVLCLQLSDIQRFLQLAPLRFAALDVDLFLHKVLATIPPPPPQYTSAATATAAAISDTNHHHHHHHHHHHSHDIHALVRLGASHAIRGNYAEAIRAMDLAEKMQPLFFEAYYKQALAWSRLGDTHAVIKLSLQTLALFPHHQGAHYLLALAYSHTKRRDEAVEVIKQGLRLNPWAFNLASDLKTLLQE